MQKILSIRTASILKKLKGGLVASCQPVDGGTLDHPKIVTAMAQAVISTRTYNGPVTPANPKVTPAKSRTLRAEVAFYTSYAFLLYRTHTDA